MLNRILDAFRLLTIWAANVKDITAPERDQATALANQLAGVLDTSHGTFKVRLELLVGIEQEIAHLRPIKSSSDTRAIDHN